MCDYSLHHVQNRKAAKGDTIRTHSFGVTRGFSDTSPELTSPVAVCLLPGTEVGFDKPVEAFERRNPILDALTGRYPIRKHAAVAVFTQINKDEPAKHHDALEFADGTCILVNDLVEGQTAHVLQLPAEPKKPADEQDHHVENLAKALDVSPEDLIA